VTFAMTCTFLEAKESRDYVSRVLTWTNLFFVPAVRHLNFTMMLPLRPHFLSKTKTPTRDERVR
jgi:hypothetical protein